MGSRWRQYAYIFPFTPYFPIFLYSCTPVFPYSCIPVLLYSRTPILLYSYTPVLLYSCTPVLLHSCTPALLHSCTPALLYSLIQIGKRLISRLQPMTTIAEPFSNRLSGSGLIMNLPSLLTASKFKPKRLRNCNSEIVRP